MPSKHAMSDKLQFVVDKLKFAGRSPSNIVKFAIHSACIV